MIIILFKVIVQRCTDTIRNAFFFYITAHPPPRVNKLRVREELLEKVSIRISPVGHHSCVK